MKLSRRKFLQLTGATTAAVVAVDLGFNLTSSEAATDIKINYGQQISSICCFCSVGCGVIATVKDGEIINLEGDPDHPINEGALCSKGSAYSQIGTNSQRQTAVLYRAPGASDWEVKSWDWALDRIAQRVKTTRDETFVHKNQAGVIVNRTEAIASLGSAMINNEECYAIAKLMRSLGLVNLEHQARI